MWNISAYGKSFIKFHTLFTLRTLFVYINLYCNISFYILLMRISIMQAP